MRIGSRVLAAALLLWAAGATAKPATLVFEPESGLILEAADHLAPRYPASLTKMMTAYLALEAIAEGRLKRAEPLPISAAAASQPPVKLGLRRGNTITVEEVLQATILKSANDAAVVLAEAVAGDERHFAHEMSRKARTLGMRGTTFLNATGLPERSHVSTAYDMGLLAAALMRDFPDAFDLFSRTSFSYAGRRYRTINGWLSQYPGADGIKTGFTCAAGYNLVASAKRQGRRLVAVLMGSTSPGARSAKARALMDRGFEALAESAGRDAGLERLDERAGPGPGGVAPHVLPTGACVETVQPESEIIEAAPFPGWGIIFGSYPSRSQALEKIERYRARLGPLAEEARPAVVSKARAGVLRYSALLVALPETESLTACQQLRDDGAYCLRLRPEVLNNEDARWR